MKRTSWWKPPRDTLSAGFVRTGMPATLAGFVRSVSAAHQLWISLLAVAVFAMNTAPLEMQRRILNAALLDRNTRLVIALAAVYAAIVVASGLLKLLLNVYGGWIGEKATRTLRLSATTLADGVPARQKDPRVQGVEISLIIAEPEAVGGFVGVAVSELVLQIGILVSVFGYMFYVQPTLALVCLLLFLPQIVFVPLMQSAINRRVQTRISKLRRASIGVLLARSEQTERAFAAQPLRRNIRPRPWHHRAAFLDEIPDELHAEHRQGARPLRRRIFRRRGTRRRRDRCGVRIGTRKRPRSMERPHQLVSGDDARERQVP